MQSCSKSSLLINVTNVNFWSSHELQKASGYIEIKFRYAQIPPQLKTLISTEPVDLIRTGMKYVVEQIISETLIEHCVGSSSSSPQTGSSAGRDDLSRLTPSVHHVLLRSASIMWSKNKRIHSSADELKRQFVNLCSQITFHECHNTFTATAISPEPDRSLQNEGEQETTAKDYRESDTREEGGGDRAEEADASLQFIESRFTAEHIPTNAVRSRCIVNWPLDAEVSVDNLDLCPVVVAISTVKYLENTYSSEGMLMGVTVLRTCQLADKASSPYRTVWKGVHAPLCYTVLPPDSSVPQTFSTMWRVIEYLSKNSATDELTPPEDITKAVNSILQCIKQAGDHKALPSGYSVKCSFMPTNSCIFGEMCIRTLFVRKETNATGIHNKIASATDDNEEADTMVVNSMLRSIRAYQEYLNTHERLPFDMYGGALLPTLYNPNLYVAGNSAQVGQATFEIHDYDFIRRAEKYQQYLSMDSLLRWKDFLVGISGAAQGEMVQGGREQWINIETTFETIADEVPWNGNWLHSVNYRLYEQAPRFLVEVWVNEEFAGELLLPELQGLASHQRSLWPLVEDASCGDGITRKDYRKRTAPICVKGWIHLDAQWDVTNPRGGLLTLELKELRNISTKSISETDVMPGAPQVTIWKFDPVKKEWSNVGKFRTFEHALYFIGDSKGEDIMGHLWQWDALTLGPQPTWFNYFSWSKPGRMKTFAQEIPLKIVQKIPLKRSLHLTKLTSTYSNPRALLWNLCRVGIPDIMRPYVWTELSGAYVSRRYLDSWLTGHNKVKESAYDYLMQVMLCSEAPLFTCIEEDLDVFASTFGIDTSHREMISRVIRCLMLFCSSNNDEIIAPTGDTMHLPRVQETGFGSPITYSYRLLAVAYYLSLDFSGQRIPEDEIFYLLLNLFSAEPEQKVNKEIHKAPFHAYYSSKTTKCFSSKTNCTVYSEAILLRLAFERYHPSHYAKLTKSGFNIEAAFAPVFGSLFAGCLPAPTLYRLWDLLLNIVWTKSTILKESHAGPEVQSEQHVVASKRPSSRKAKRTSQSSQKSSEASKHSAASVSRDDSNELNESGSSVICTPEETLFDGSSGRLILFCLSYQILVQIANRLPEYATPAEVKDSMTLTMTSLRNPCDIPLYIDLAYSALFSTASDIENLKALWYIELDSRARQIKYQVQLGSLLEKMIRDNDDAFYVLGYDTDSCISRRDKVYGIVSEQRGVSGLSTNQIYRLIYPSSKYHCLYANDEIRKLPPGTQGRLVLQVSSIQFLKNQMHNPIELFVTFQNTVHRYKPKFIIKDHTYQLNGDSICVFHIDTPPPYHIRIGLRDLETGEMIAKQNKPIQIMKLTTQGSTRSCIKRDQFTGTAEIQLHYRYTLNVPTTDFFLPDIDGRSALSSSALKPGTGRWGDLLPFDPMYVQLRGNTKHVSPIDLISQAADTGATGADDEDLLSRVLEPFNPINRPRYFSGFNRVALEELMAFILPPGIAISEELIATHGRVKDRNNFQTAFSTAVSYREILTTLIMLSSGSLLNKVELLFDLYGHHEPEKIDAQKRLGENSEHIFGSNGLYYHPMVSVPDIPSPIHYKQMASLQRLSQIATSCSKFLPADCPPEILNDSRVLRDSISMYEIVGMVTQILTKSGIHMNSVDIIKFCFQTFDPMRRLPRVLGATVRTIDPVVSANGTPIDGASRNSENKDDPRSMCGTGLPPGINPNKLLPFMNMCAGNTVQELAITKPLDVTAKIAAWVDRSSSETQWWGLNFFKYNTLASLGIQDPFPSMAKKLDIVISPSGDLQDVNLISADLDEYGNITGGQGGNYLVLANSLNKEDTIDADSGAWAAMRQDLFVREGNKSLLSICYAFELSAFVYAKYHFVMSLLACSLLTDCLRRSSACSRRFNVLEPLNVSCYMNVPFSADFHKNVLGLNFRNLQPNKLDIYGSKHKSKLALEDSSPQLSKRSSRKRRNDKESASDVNGKGQYLDERKSPRTIPDDSSSPLYRERDHVMISKSVTEFTGIAVHGTAVSENFMDAHTQLKPQVIVAVKSIRGLKETTGTVYDLIVECTYDDKSDLTEVKRDTQIAEPVEFYDKFLYYLVSGCNTIQFSIIDVSSEEIIGDAVKIKDYAHGSLLGKVQLDFGSLLQQTRFQAHLSLPILNQQREVGELDVSVAFTGFNDDVNQRPKMSEAKELLSTAMVGELAPPSNHVRIKLLKASSLQGHMSLFCQISTETDVLRSRTLEDVDNGVGVWNDTFSFNIYSNDRVVFRLIDDQRARDVVLGEGALNLKKLKNGIHRVPIYEDGSAGLEDRTILHSASFDDKRIVGYIDVDLEQKSGPLPSTDTFDWGCGNVRMVIDRAFNLPPALCQEDYQTYVSVELEKQKERSIYGHTPNPVWQTAITYTCKSGSSNCFFTVYAKGPSGEETILGKAMLNMAEARRRCGSAKATKFKLPLDGLCQGTGGVLWIETEFIAYPSNLNKYQFLRVQINGVREMRPNMLAADAGRVLINLGQVEMSTSVARVNTSYDENSLIYKETFDIPFNKNETISFTLVDADTGEEVCGCAYDLWTALRMDRESIRGDLWMKRQDEGLCKLRLQISYVSALPQPWPDACIVDIASLECYSFGSSPLTVSVRDATAYGNFAENFDHDKDDESVALSRRDRMSSRLHSGYRSDDDSSTAGIGKRFHVGRTYGLRYSGQSAIWLDVAVGETEIWSSEIGVSEKALREALKSSSSMTNKCSESEFVWYPLFHGGREVGQVAVKLRYICRPKFVSYCTFLKLQITDLAKVDQHFKSHPDGCPRAAYLTVDLDHKNTVQCPPVKILGSRQVIDCNWVAPYRQQPIVRFTLRNEKGYALSTADLNIWDIMAQSESHSLDERILVPLYQRDGRKGGKVYVKLDFICHPRDMRFPKQILVGFSHGLNIGGEYAYERGAGEITVRVKSGENILVPPKTTNHVWGNWCDLLNLAPNDHTLCVEVYDKSSVEVLGSLYIHIWDLFRNPFVEWCGGLQISSKDHKQVGTVFLAMRLVIAQRLSVHFGSLAHNQIVPYEQHVPLKYTKIFPSSTPRDIRRKFIAACREIAETTPNEEDRFKYKYVTLTPNCRTTYVDVNSGTKVVLPEKSTLLSIFPQCVDKAHGQYKIIDLCLVLLNSKRKRENRLVVSELAEGVYESAYTYDAGAETVCTFPLAETAQYFVSTLPREELTWVHMTNESESCAPTDSATPGTRVGMRTNRLSQLCEKTFELHPGADAPLGSLGYAYLPLAELRRLRHNLKWTASNLLRILNRKRQSMLGRRFGRSAEEEKDESYELCLRYGQWVPVVIHAITSANSLISRVAPVETVVGYDLPDYSRTCHVSTKAVLPSFDESDINERGRKALVYRNCGSGRTAPYRSSGSVAPWVAPELPRTNSMR